MDNDQGLNKMEECIDILYIFSGLLIHDDDAKPNRMEGAVQGSSSIEPEFELIPGAGEINMGEVGDKDPHLVLENKLL